MQPNTTKANQLKSTQNSLLISEVKDGVVVLTDGSLRAVVLASAINFDLMSRQEQDSVEYAYQGFLNSLHFPIQIVIRSQKVSLDNYIEGLQQKQNAQDNELLAMLMEDYIANIKALIDEVNIMNKQFYVVIPYFPPVITKDGFFSNLSGIFKGTGVTTVQEADFNQYKQEVSQRVALVASGLNQMGIRAIPLNSQELIDLYYSTYNPDVAMNQKLIEASQIQSPVVTRTEPPESLRPALPPEEPAPAIVEPIAVAPTPPPAPPEPVPAYVAPVVVPEPVAPATVPEPVAPPVPIPVTPIPQLTQTPAVNPTNFDPYAISLPTPPQPTPPPVDEATMQLPTPPGPAPEQPAVPITPADQLATQAAEAVAASLPDPTNGGAQ